MPPKLVSLAGGLIGMFPTSAQALAGHIISRLPFTPFNMVCTNVPGPQQPLYLLGHKMLHCYPYVPIGGEMPLNCAILTYNGMAYFGFSGCAHAVPDLRRLEEFLQLSFTELKEAAGAQIPKTETRAKQEKKSASETNEEASEESPRESEGCIGASGAPPNPRRFEYPIAVPPRVPVESAKAPVLPRVKKGQVSPQCDRVTIVEAERGNVENISSAAQVNVLVSGTADACSCSFMFWASRFFSTSSPSAWSRSSEANVISVLTGHWLRLGRVLKFWLVQWKQPRYKLAGTLHIFIFAGFILLAVRRFLGADCRCLPEFRDARPFGRAGPIYNIITDYAATIVFLCMVIAVVRRAGFQTCAIRGAGKVRKRSHRRRHFYFVADRRS